MPRRSIKISKDEKDEKVLTSIAAPKENEVLEVKGEDSAPKRRMVFISRGDVTIGFPETGKRFKKYDGIGNETIVDVRRKELKFTNRTAETNDPEVVECAKRHQEFKTTFYYHPEWCPPDGDKALATELLDDKKDYTSEIRERAERAKEFDKLAHPEGGIEDAEPSSEWS